VSGLLQRSEWFTADELAELRLPALPWTKRKINLLARDAGWESRPAATRGGGLEYPVSALPAAARIELVRAGRAPAPDAPGPEAGIWAAWERATDAERAKATAKLAALDSFQGFLDAGMTRSRAAELAALAHDCSGGTIWGALAAVKGAARADWAPLLLPRFQGGGRKAAVDDGVYRTFASLWLRLSKPTFEDSYRRTREWAAANGGLTVPSLKTLQRRLLAETPREVIVLKREGREALKTLVPAQKRSVADLVPLQLVNIDGHQWDVFVRFPARAWEKEVVARPVMVAIQDIASGKVLAWRIGRAETAILTRLAFGDLFRRFGIPDACLLDNGRAFASKWITGGALNRYRFKVREDEPLGLLTQLGIRNHWATPYHGQAKPIERAFRDFAQDIAKHPAFAGAYTGNRPDAKPENYGAAAVPLATFEAVVAAEIARHNSREGRRGRSLDGRSFDAVFEAGYASAPIRRATTAELNLALLTAERLRADPRDGSIAFLGNRYWAEGLGALAGKPVVVRFDPDNLQSDIHVYTAAGALFATVPCWEAVGFQDAAAAQRQARLRSDVRKAATRLTAAEELLSEAELAERLAPAPDEPPVPEPRVVRPVRLVRGSAAPAFEIDSPRETAAPHFIDRWSRGALRLVGD
jgi:hypothetical protein